jgi:hypothetical protein
VSSRDGGLDRPTRRAAWEYAHGHDARTKCYPEYGCRAIEMERDRLLDRVEELEAFVRRVADNCGPWGDPTELTDLADDAAVLLSRL